MTLKDISAKLDELNEEELDLVDQTKRNHNLESETNDIDVPLNWDEERDFEYLYDRMDLFSALCSIVDNTVTDTMTKEQAIEMLMDDAAAVISERKADMRKAQTVIDDMEQILTVLADMRATDE